MMGAVGDPEKDKEYIENAIKAALNSDPEISDDKQVKAVSKKTRGSGKHSESEYEETLINIKDCYKIFRPMVEKAVFTATRELVERQTTIESNLLDKIGSLENEIKNYKSYIADKMIDSTIRDDALEMYNRRDSIRIYGVPQTDVEKTNSRVTVNKVMNIIKEIDLEDVVKVADISACHRIHRRNKKNDLPDPIIIKFVSRQSKELVIANASKIRDKTSSSVSKQYINEDLTPLRSRLLTYIKTKIPTVVSKSVHSREGRILCKKDEEQAKWIYIESIRDLKRTLNIDITPELLKDLEMDSCVPEQASA